MSATKELLAGATLVPKLGTVDKHGPIFLHIVYVAHVNTMDP